jgi:NAD(P)-dependent dehydrogenase (short-subunit alcohol dehydrogenase family)
LEDDVSVALVTGANRGIGRETVRQLAARGLTVLLCGRDAAGCDAAAAEITEGEVVGARADVTDAPAMAALAERIGREYGRLDMLVNNAGVFRGAEVAAMTAGPVREMLEVNVLGVITTTQAMLPLLARAAAPRVVNLSSTTASIGLAAAGAQVPGNAAVRAAYAASKAAVNMLTVHYATAFAEDPALRRIKVNAAAPGWTATRMNDFQGERSVQDGAWVVVRLALLPDDGPSGGFFDDRGPIPW